MYNILNLLNKPVLALYEGEIVGQVQDFIFDRKLHRLELIQISGEDSTCYIAPSAIYNVGKNAITIKNKTQIKSQETEDGLFHSMIGARAFTIEGEYIGKLQDIELANNRGTVKEFVFSEQIKLPANRLASASQNSIVFTSENSKIKISRFKFVKRKPKAEKPTTLPANQLDLQLTPVSVNTNNMQHGISFIVGKICTKDIFGINEETIIKKGARINSSLIEAAIKFGKLKELMLYCE